MPMNAKQIVVVFPWLCFLASVAIAQSRQQEADQPLLFAVERQRGAAWDARLPMNQQANWDEHVRFMNHLAADGIVQHGGPLAEGEEILLIVKAKDEALARASFDDDPWSKAKLLTIKSVRRWTVLLQGGDEAAIRQTLQHYLQAHVTGNPEHLKKAFHPEAKLLFVREGKLAQMTLDDYGKRFSGKPAEDEAQRRRKIESIEIDGNAAMARITFDYPATFTTDFMLLLKLDGEWRIVQKSFYVRIKPKP